MAVLPVLRSSRPLVPGTRMAVRSESHCGLEPGDEIVVIPRLAGEDARVGTLGRVDGASAASGGHALFDISGHSLVSIEEAGESRATVHPIDDDGTDDELIAPALSALRRYMAVRSEAGEGGDVHVQLSGDPVAASHEVASHLRVSGPEVQDVLEAGTASDRLQRATRVLEREIELLEAVLGRGR